MRGPHLSTFEGAGRHLFFANFLEKIVPPHLTLTDVLGVAIDAPEPIAGLYIFISNIAPPAAPQPHARTFFENL